MSVRLRIKEVAEREGLCLAQIQREAKLPITTARRYWYSSRSGLARDAGTLSEVNLDTLGKIAALLKVCPGDLLSDCWLLTGYRSSQLVATLKPSCSHRICRAVAR